MTDENDVSTETKPATPQNQMTYHEALGEVITKTNDDWDAWANLSSSERDESETEPPFWYRVRGFDSAEGAQTALHRIRWGTTEIPNGTWTFHAVRTPDGDVGSELWVRFDGKTELDGNGDGDVLWVRWYRNGQLVDVDGLIWPDGDGVEREED